MHVGILLSSTGIGMMVGVFAVSFADHVGRRKVLLGAFVRDCHSCIQSCTCRVCDTFFLRSIVRGPGFLTLQRIYQTLLDNHAV